MPRKKYYDRYKAKGQCQECKELALVGHDRCEEHLKKHNERVLKAKKKRQEEGRCRECGRPMQEEEIGVYANCIVCRTWRGWREPWA